MEGEAKNFLKAWLIVLPPLCYCYFIASKFQKGMLRFISIVPILYLFTILPISLHCPIPIVIISGFITWLANFKLLMFSFDIGPLSTSDPQRSFIRFIFLAAFPIKIKGKHQQSANDSQDVRNFTPDDSKSCFKMEPTKVTPLNFWSKCLVFVLLEGVYYYINNMVVMCVLMYLFIDITFGVCNLLVMSTLGIELDPPSNEPYLSTSLQDFWGKRWNRMISDVLRNTIFKPVGSMTMYFLGRRWTLNMATMATFLVSGLMHELIYYYMTRVSPTWEVTWFFVLHGVCVTLEIEVKRALGQKWSLHWAVSGPLTVGFVMYTGFWLFFPQIMRNQVDVRVTEDILDLGKYLKEIVY